MFNLPVLYIKVSLLSDKVLLTKVHPSTVKFPLLSMTLTLNPLITISSMVTSEFSSIVKKLKSVEFASKTTSPSGVIVNFLFEIINPILSAPV